MRKHRRFFCCLAVVLTVRASKVAAGSSVGPPTRIEEIQPELQRGPYGLGLGPFDLALSATLSETYDDNVTRAHLDLRDDFITQWALGTQFSRFLNKFRYLLFDYQVAYFLYLKEPHLSHDEHQASLELNFFSPGWWGEPQDGWYLKLGEEFASEQSALDFVGGHLVRYQRSEGAVVAGYRWRKWGAELGYQNSLRKHAQQNFQRLDQVTHTLFGDFSWYLVPGLSSIYARIAHASTNYTKRIFNDFVTESLLLGYRGLLLSHKVRADLGLGAQRIWRLDDRKMGNDYGDFATLAGRMELTWNLRDQLSTLTFNAQRTLEPSTAASYAVRTQVRASYDHTFNTDARAGVGPFFSWSDRPKGVDMVLQGLGLNFNYRLSAFFDFSATYDFQVLSSQNPEQNYEQSALTASLTARF